MSDGFNLHGAVANELCEKALKDALNQLHPLLQNVEPYRLAHRPEFLHSFRSALERRIARRLAVWQPGIQAIFRYDEAGRQNNEPWDGSIRLLARVPRLSSAIKTWSKKLDRCLVKSLKQLALPHFQNRQTILEIHQVTPPELRHGIGYGAMFFAVYNVPSKVWP